MAKFIKINVYSAFTICSFLTLVTANPIEDKTAVINDLKLKCVEDIKNKVAGKPSCTSLKKDYGVKMSKTEIKEIVAASTPHKVHTSTKPHKDKSDNKRQKPTKCDSDAIPADKKDQCRSIFAEMNVLKADCTKKTDPACLIMKDLKHQILILSGKKVKHPKGTKGSKKNKNGDLKTKTPKEQLSDEKKQLLALKAACKESKAGFKNKKVKTTECQTYGEALEKDPSYVDKSKSRPQKPTRPPKLSKIEKQQKKEQKQSSTNSSPCDSLQDNTFEKDNCVENFKKVPALKKQCKEAKATGKKSQACELLKEALVGVPNPSKPGKESFQRPPKQQKPSKQQKDKEPGNYVQMLYADSVNPSDFGEFSDHDLEAQKKQEKTPEPQPEPSWPSEPTIEEEEKQQPITSARPAKGSKPGGGKGSRKPSQEESNQCEELIASGLTDWSLEYCEDFYMVLDQSRIICKEIKQAGEIDSQECIEYKQMVDQLPPGFGAPGKPVKAGNRKPQKGRSLMTFESEPAFQPEQSDRMGSIPYTFDGEGDEDEELEDEEEEDVDMEEAEFQDYGDDVNNMFNFNAFLEDVSIFSDLNDGKKKKNAMFMIVGEDDE